MPYIRIINLIFKLCLEEPGNVEDKAEEDDRDDVPHESDMRVPVPSDVSVVVGEADGQVSGNISKRVSTEIKTTLKLSHQNFRQPQI